MKKDSSLWMLKRVSDILSYIGVLLIIGYFLFICFICWLFLSQTVRIGSSMEDCINPCERIEGGNDLEFLAWCLSPCAVGLVFLASGQALRRTYKHKLASQNRLSSDNDRLTDDDYNLG